DLATDHIFVRDNFELSVIDFGMSSFLHRLSHEKYRSAHNEELRNFGLVMCYLLIENPMLSFGSPELCMNVWGEAMSRLRAMVVSPELVEIIERSVAADLACRPITTNGKPPYSEVADIFTALEQVSSLL